MAPWLDHLKLDGYRAIAFKTDGKVYLRSRNDKDFGLRYTAVGDASLAVPRQAVKAGLEGLVAADA